MHINRKISFCLAFCGILFGPLFFPLFYFAPYLISTFYGCSRISVLWRAIGCGLLVDLLSSGQMFGITSITYCLVCWILYGQTRNFFMDKLSTLPILTFLFSVLATLVSVVLSVFFGHSASLGFGWIITDLIMMPFFDSCYALIVFSLPFHLTYKLNKMRIFRKIRR